MRHPRAPLVAALVAAVLTALPAAAQAPPPAPPEEDAGARAVALAREGVALYEAGQWAEAEAKFAEAEAKLHSPVFELYVARCRRNANDAAGAREVYARVAASTLPADAPPPWRQAVVDAKAELAALDQAAARPAPAAAPAPSPEPPRPTRPPEPTPREGSLVPGAIVLGLGVAGLGVGAITGAMALGKNGDIEDTCPGGVCASDDDAAAQTATLDEAGTLADVATISFIAGGVLATAGVVLLVVRPFGGDDVEVQAAPGALRLRASF